jgi:hypothetical protein
MIEYECTFTLIGKRVAYHYRKTYPITFAPDGYLLYLSRQAIDFSQNELGEGNAAYISESVNWCNPNKSKDCIAYHYRVVTIADE